MQISGRFTIAIHIFTCIEILGKEHNITSEFLSGSINVHPVIIRRILIQLKAAGLINTSQGRSSMTIARPIESITFYDVYKALECVGSEGLFRFHENPNPDCPVGRNIHRVLEGRLEHVQQVMEDELKRITIADVVKDTLTEIH